MGDEILRKVAAILRATLRWTDLIARYGGDEFAALIMETPRRSALHAAERLRKAVEEQFEPTSPEELAIGMELVLEGLTQHLKIAREDLDSKVSYTEMLKFNLVRSRTN